MRRKSRSARALLLTMSKLFVINVCCAKNIGVDNFDNIHNVYDLKINMEKGEKK